MFLVVVVALVQEDPPDSEEVAKLFQTRDAFGALCHDEPMKHLIAGPVALPTCPVWLPDEANGEAPFSVYKASYPATELDQPFLLIFRTRHFVTVDVLSDATSSARFTGFPAYSQMHTAPLPTRGATNCLRDIYCPFRPRYLRTVIVTAAVYRGLDSKLRPKANLSS